MVHTPGHAFRSLLFSPQLMHVVTIQAYEWDGVRPKPLGPKRKKEMTDFCVHVVTNPSWYCKYI